LVLDDGVLDSVLAEMRGEAKHRPSQVVHYVARNRTTPACGLGDWTHQSADKDLVTCPACKEA
jgi:hypothetical protein